MVYMSLCGFPLWRQPLGVDGFLFPRPGGSGVQSVVARRPSGYSGCHRLVQICKDCKDV